MFRKIADKTQLSYYRSVAKKGGLTCPACSAGTRLIPESADQVITCTACGTQASLHEWTPQAGLTRSGNPDLPPNGTKIVRDTSVPGATVWKIPASGRSGGLLFFAIFWCTITGIVSGAFLFGTTSGDSDSAKPPLLILIPFFSIFWAVGIGMFYAGFRSKYARHQLTVTDSTVTLRRELFGRTKEKSLPVSGITSVSQVEFYQKNYQPVHGVEIKGTGGKLRFGSMLTDEEKAWLVADLRRALSSPEEVAAVAQGLAPAVRQSYFSFVIPNSKEGLLPHAILFSLIGIAFVGVGIFLMDSGSHSSRPPDLFDRVFDGVHLGFRMIWIAISSVFMLGGLVALGWLLRSRNQETRLEANDSEIAIRTYKHGLIIKERTFPRGSVRDLRTSVSGSSNGKTRKRIELIVNNKAETLAHWMDGEKADTFATEARSALG